jgi:hypothetical protein
MVWSHCCRCCCCCCRTDPRTGKPSTQWETVWSRVQVRLAWERRLQPEEEDMQVYASWKYFRCITCWRDGSQELWGVCNHRL